MSVINTLKFAPMLITDVFETMKASHAWYDKSKLSATGEARYPFVSRIRSSNGVEGLCPRQGKEPEPGNAVTIGLDTQTIGYQPVPFYTSQNIQVLRHPLLNERNGMVLASVIEQQMGKFSWGGNGATLGRLRKTRIMVPVTADSTGEQIVDWDGMDQLSQELLGRVIAQTGSTLQTDQNDDDTLPDLTFEPVLITDVFETMKASSAWYDKVHLKGGHGENLYLSQTQAGNSVAGIVADQDLDPEPGNCITITLKTQSTFYQPAPFYTAQNFLIFRHPQLDEPSGLFLVAELRRAMTKFSWGHGVSMARLRKTRIMVPVTSGRDGSTVVDWNGMRRYGRAVRVHVERSMTQVLEPMS